jgi:hypothetical protein
MLAAGKQKTVLLTFDYEIFLGKISGTAEKCMIQPTKTLLALLEKHKVKNAIFFVDVTYLCKLKNLAHTNTKIQADYKNICDQILHMLKSGHYVFPHLHPHWIDAKYNGSTNMWDLSEVAKYRFNSLEEKDKEKMFDEGILFLKELILPVFPDYKIDSFRAGGLSIQPFTDFKPYFAKYGIKNDFSVLPKMYEIGSVHSRYFDFRNTSHLNYYKFNENIETVDFRGDFTEFSISRIHTNSLEKILNKTILKINSVLLDDRTPGDGVGTQFDETVEKSDSDFEVVSLEWSNFYKTRKYLKKLDRDNYLHFLSHPKMLSPKNFEALDFFLDHLIKDSVNFDFKLLLSERPSIVVCSHILPPEPGIGGRRWAKFSKYFKKHGFNVHLLSAELTKNNIVSPWIKDIENNEITRLPRKYPDILDQVPTSIFEKFRFLITRLFFQLRVKGTIYDRSVNWEKQFNDYFDELIAKNNIYGVISTGAPFNLMFLTAKLKKRYPHLKIINDFRDPWTWGEIYGFKGLEPSRWKFENFKESETIKLSDYITSSAQFIHEVLEKKYPEHKNKFQLIPHGFDKEDFFDTEKKPHGPTSKIKILYGGTLYENLFEKLDFILKLASAYPEKIEIDFYTGKHQYEKLFKSYGLKNVKLHNQVNAKEFFKIIGKYDYYLCITNDRIKDNISTKYYEIFANKTPIIYYGPHGYISEMISTNNVGLLIDDKNGLEFLYSNLQENIRRDWEFEKIGLEKYDFENLSGEFEKLILN